jgi:hypothetical protein
MAHYQLACPCPWLRRPHPELGSNLKKQAQDGIAELRLALTQHAVLNPPADSLQSVKSPPELTPQPLGDDSDDRQAVAFTENQALGAAISKPSHDANQVDSNAMEEDHHKPIVTGSSSSDSAFGVLSKQTASVLSKESVKAEDESMKKSSSLSSSSSSSSSSSFSSDDTEDLANRLKKTNSTPTTPSPKNLATLDKLSGSDLDSASHQGPGHDLDPGVLLYWSNPVSQVLRAMAFKRTTRGRSNFGELMTVKIS